MYMSILHFLVTAVGILLVAVLQFPSISCLAPRAEEALGLSRVGPFHVSLVSLGGFIQNQKRTESVVALFACSLWPSLSPAERGD